jgi:hypothetical protein
MSTDKRSSFPTDVESSGVLIIRGVRCEGVGYIAESVLQNAHGLVALQAVPPSLIRRTKRKRPFAACGISLTCRSLRSQPNVHRTAARQPAACSTDFNKAIPPSRDSISLALTVLPNVSSDAASDHRARLPVCRAMTPVPIHLATGNDCGSQSRPIEHYDPIALRLAELLFRERTDSSRPSAKRHAVAFAPEPAQTSDRRNPMRIECPETDHLQGIRVQDLFP